MSKINVVPHHSSISVGKAIQVIVVIMTRKTTSVAYVKVHTELCINKRCLEYKRQKGIKETMIKNCISYMEAVKLHPPISKMSYADVLLQPSFPSLNATTSSRLPSSVAVTNNISQYQSYKKTVFKKPWTPPTSSKGYDLKAHNDIIREPSLPPSKPITINDDNNKPYISIADIIKLTILKIITASLINKFVSTIKYSI